MIGHQEWMVPSHPNPVINPIVSSHLGAHAIHTLVNSTMFYFTSFYHVKSSRQNLDIIKLCLGCTWSWISYCLIVGSIGFSCGSAWKCDIHGINSCRPPHLPRTWSSFWASESWTPSTLSHSNSNSSTTHEQKGSCSMIFFDFFPGLGLFSCYWKIILVLTSPIWTVFVAFCTLNLLWAEIVCLRVVCCWSYSQEFARHVLHVES